LRSPSHRQITTGFVSLFDEGIMGESKMLRKLLKRMNQPEKSRGVASKSRLSYQALEDRRLLAIRVWDGGGLTNNWTNANNWVNDVAPVAGDALAFPAGVSDKVADNNFAADTFFSSITVGGGYELRGARVLLGTGGIVSNGSSNFIKHKVNLGAAGSGNRPIQVNAGSTLFMDDDIAGSNGLNKTGGGDLSLRNNNSYAGVTDIVAGRIFIERDEALGAFSSASAKTIIRGGTQLVLNDNLPAAVLRVDEPITIENGGSIRGLNDAHLRGNLVTNGTATLQHDGSLIERLLVTGQISGAGGLTIANGSGQVLMNGDVGNTYQGLTNVQGKLRLDHVGDNAISGNLTIGNTGTVRMNGPNQISDGATVTINGGGVMLTDGFDETVNSLVMQGGLISGNKISLVDSLDNVSTIFTPVTKIFDYIRGSYPFDNAKWQVNQLVATSDGTGLAAHMLDLNLNLTSTTGLVQVNDGVGATDFLVNSRISSNGSVLTFSGLGRTVLQDKPMENYVVNAGQLNLARFRRDVVSFDFSSVDVTVNAGGKFSSDTTIRNLTVNTGGRVRPGPLNFELSLPNIGQLLRGTSLKPGTLNLNGDLTMAAGAIMEVQINGAIAGAQHEQIDVLGTVQIDGAVVEATMGGNVSPGQNYRIINNGNTDPIFGFISIPSSTGPFLTASNGQKLAVNHSGGLFNNDLVLTLQNTPPMAPNLTINRTRINEGGIVTVTGSLVDPDQNDSLRLFIDWGDGSRRVAHPGRNQFSFSHRYKQDGVYTARFEWLDQTGQGNSKTFQVQVDNVAPALQLFVRRDGNGRAVLSGWLNDPGNDKLTLSVNYGDGSNLHQRRIGNNTFFTLRHHFSQPGTYQVLVTVTDGNGGTTVLQRSVTV
jgi:autotransporter-associated beta strand protein